LDELQEQAVEDVGVVVVGCVSRSMGEDAASTVLMTRSEPELVEAAPDPQTRSGPNSSTR
jgi:hypothetical protein